MENRFSQAAIGASAAVLSVGIATATEAATFSSTDTPLGIIDGGTINSTIDVSGLDSINDVNIAIDLSHGWFGDLDVFLESPTGTIVELFTDILEVNVASGTYTLDDEAATNITASGATPGTYTPETDTLSSFDGEDPNGIWTLIVTDDDPIEDNGTLNGWELIIEAAPTSQQMVQLLRYLALQERVGDLKSTAATLSRLSTGLAANNARAGVANSFATRDRLPAFDLASGAPVVVSTKNGKLVGKVHTWMELSGFLARQDSSRKFTGTGVQLGADVALSPNWVLGVSAGNDDLNARTPLGTTEGDFTFAQPYLGYQRGDWSGELSLLYGEADYTQTTVGGQGTADSEVWSVNLSLARNVTLSDTTRLTPMGSVHYGEETITGTGGTLALAGKSTVDFSEYSLGARLTHETGEGMSYVGLHADYVASGAAVALAGRGFDPEGLSGRVELGTGFPISGNGNVALGIEAGGLGSNLTEYTGQIRVSFEF